MIQPKQGDIDLLVQIIDLRDSAHLAGHTDKPFGLIRLNGGQSVLVSPGRAGNTPVSTFAIQRLQDLGLFRVTNPGPKMVVFDLVDDFRDRLEEMRVAADQPSRLGEAQAANERAEAARQRAEASQHDLQVQVEAAAASRASRRAAFAVRAGRRVRIAATIALGAFFLVVIVAGYFLSSNLPLALVIAVVAVAVPLAVVDWLLHIDGFAIAAGVEAWAVRRITRWLESFDMVR